MPRTKKTEAAEGATAKKPATTKAPAKSKTGSNAMKTTVVLQYAEKSVPYDDFVKTVKDIWTGQYQKELSEIDKLDLYIKPEENKVYFVINNEIQGNFDI